MVCWGMQKVGCYLCVSPIISQPASVDITWSCPGPQQYLSYNSPDTYLMLSCSAEQQNEFRLLPFHFFPPSISPFLVLFFSFFCSSLSSKTMRTLSTPSRLAALRPARKKWQLKMMATWSHTRPRRWWQVDKVFQSVFSYLDILTHLHTLINCS